MCVSATRTGAVPKSGNSVMSSSQILGGVQRSVDAPVGSLLGTPMSQIQNKDRQPPTAQCPIDVRLQLSSRVVSANGL